MYGLNWAQTVGAAYTNVEYQEVKGCGHEMLYFGWDDFYPSINVFKRIKINQMKESVLLFCFALCVSFASKAQDINWRSLNEPYKHLAAISFGADYTSNYGIAYGYKLPQIFQ